MTTNRARTAIARQNFSKPYRRLLETGAIHSGLTVIDYGCGKGYDVRRLQEHGGLVDVSLDGLNIRGYDPFQPGFNCPEYLEMAYDVATCNYVMNVIEDPQERGDVLQELVTLAPVVYLTVRADAKAAKPTWTKYLDGYITPNKTFQKFYTVDEAIREFARPFFTTTVEHSDASEITLKLERND